MGISSATGSVGFMPVGVVVPFAGSTSPAGWQLCYGQAISRTTYAGLFATISTTYGVGDGSTTFNVPDLRGRAVAGKDDMGGSAASRITNGVAGITATTLGAAGGNELLATHTHASTLVNNAVTTAAVGNHTHNTPYPVGFAGGGYGTALNASIAPNYSTTTGAGGHTHSVTSNVTITNASAGTGSSANMPPTMVLNYIIKAA